MLENSWRHKLQKRYGITVEKYNELKEAQGEKCGICRSVATPLCLDHDHQSGSNRVLGKTWQQTLE
jgi:hypothetical protein